MKKTIPILAFLFASFSLQGAVEARNLFAWQLTDHLGTLRQTAVDTIPVNFQDAAPDLRAGIASDFLGNLGSPLQSKEYFRRTNKTGFLFATPYDAYLLTPSDQLYFDTRTPYTNLSYFTGGPSGRDEDRLKALFTVNASPRLNFGFNADYLYGRGIYMNQATNHFLGSFFGSYRGKRYSAFLTAAFNNLKNRENGGIIDPKYITNPEEMGNGQGTINPENIEVNLNNGAKSSLNNAELFYHHRYVVGFERERKLENDSILKEYIPVTTFAHTIQYESNRKTYSENPANVPFYQAIPAYANLYLNPESTEDEARLQTITNTLSVSLNEEFNRFARFGLTAFAENKHQPYTYFENGKQTHRTENNTALGGMLSKHLGQVFRYDVTAKLGVLGSYAGDFDLSGNVRSVIPLWGDSVQFSATGFVRNSTPDFFLEHYESNHVRWENSFDKPFRTRLHGRLAFPKLQLELHANVENLKNHIYFNTQALPEQTGQNIQVLALGGSKNFRLGNFHFEHEALYQLSSNQEAIALPAWLLEANWYYRNRFFNVLTIQLGAEVRYFSEYYAPAYMPAIGQFYAQNSQKVGNYPFVNAYVNVHLKRARFFLMYSHANYAISEPNYFLLPNYPANLSMLKIGLSWNFYD